MGIARITVTEGELRDSFGRIGEVARHEPVAIGTGERADLVLLSAAEYLRLKRRDRAALYAWELDDAAARALAAAEPPPEAAAFDSEATG
jgi:PHD/YefM family antitoxin component YafN of YafNO toxin-antitoxin module